MSCLSIAGNFIEAVKNKVLLFHSCLFSHVMRSGNSLAHDIAQKLDEDRDGVSVLPF